MWFMHDGPPAHSLIRDRRHLNQVFGEIVYVEIGYFHGFHAHRT
jgi:hypothetical protein